MKSLEALKDIITIYSNIVSTNRCEGKTRFGMCVRQIKQDLELLEKCKETLKILIDTLEIRVEMTPNIWETGKIPTLYHKYGGDLLSIEEYEKIKKWLEEEE